MFAAETLTKAKEYEKKTFTQKEIEQQRRTEADKERNARSYIGGTDRGVYTEGRGT